MLNIDSYKAVERNEMSVRDVRVDTPFEIQSAGRDAWWVVALKRCGCTGPLIGYVERVRVVDWPAVSDLPERPEDAPESSPLWVARPPTRADRKVCYAWSADDAAYELRNWLGMRNVRGVLRRTTTRKGAA